MAQPSFDDSIFDELAKLEVDELVASVALDKLVPCDSTNRRLPMDRVC